MSHILNPYERQALAALRDNPSIMAEKADTMGFGRAALESLRKLGLANPTQPELQGRQARYAITDDGWRCIYGFSKAQVDSYPDQAPVPFRIWQWPLAETRQTQRRNQRAA